MNAEKALPKAARKRLESDAWKELEEILELGLREYLKREAAVKS